MMRAGFFVRGRPDVVEMRDVPMPSLDGHVDGTCVVRGLYASLCGTDMLMSEKPRDIDWCCGASVHEVVGEVVEIKGAASKFKKGDQVLAMPSNYMTSGIFRNMTQEDADGLRKIELTGGLAEYFLSHESHLYPVPQAQSETCGSPSIPLAHFTAAQPIGTLLWMLRKVPDILHKTVAVVGQGQNGLLLTHLVANMCARKVIAIDLVPERLTAAGKMHATHTVLAGQFASVHEQVLTLTGGKGADIVFEMVGHQEETINECISLAAEGGTVIAFGVPRKDTYSINFSELFRRNIKLVGSVFPVAHEDFPFAVELIAQGRVDVAPIFSHTFPLEQSQEAFELCKRRKDQAIKVLIKLN